MGEKLGSLGGKNAASMFGMFIPTRKKKSHVFLGDQFRDHRMVVCTISCKYHDIVTYMQDMILFLADEPSKR